jgi:trehalose-phosphatase
VEDKGLSVALHARFAYPAETAEVMPLAQAIVTLHATEEFRVIGGDRFLEIAPAAANKGETVEWLFDHAPLLDAKSVYFGDDDKDEEAFLIVRRHNGIPIVVGSRQPHTAALLRLPSPTDTRLWLETLISTS